MKRNKILNNKKINGIYRKQWKVNNSIYTVVNDLSTYNAKILKM
jgi:hypothetical protein